MIKKVVFYETLTAGAASWNSDDDMRGVLQQLYVNPSNTTTTYEFWMTDDTGTNIYPSPSNTGVLVDDTKKGLYGIYTFNISNASTSDNVFTIGLIWDDSFLGS